MCPKGLVTGSIQQSLKRGRDITAEACLIYASTPVHAKLIVESLNLDLHTLCVKPIATTPDEFREIIKARKAHLDLMLVQGQNKRWNPAASKMREWLTWIRWYRRNAWRGSVDSGLDRICGERITHVTRTLTLKGSFFTLPQHINSINLLRRRAFRNM